jgi:hypothetical protein
MRPVARALAALPLAAALHAAPAAGGAADHPLVGRWEWTHTGSGCVETYEFRSDGTARVTSLEETLDERYEVSPVAEGPRRYRLTMTTVKDHGGKDCVGSTADTTGQSSVGYIELDPSADAMVFCADATRTRCMGPLRKIGPPLR